MTEPAYPKRWLPKPQGEDTWASRIKANEKPVHKPKLIQKRIEIVDGVKVPVLTYESLDRMRGERRKVSKQIVGYIALKPCGCLRGWTADLDSKYISGWLSDGCTVRPVLEGQPMPALRCRKHKKK